MFYPFLLLILVFAAVSNFTVGFKSTTTSISRKRVKPIITCMQDDIDIIENANFKYILKRVVKPSDPTTLMGFIENYMPGTKRNQIKQWLTYDHVLVNDEVQSRFDLMIQPGDFVAIHAVRTFRKKKVTTSSSQPRLHILYEDNELIAVDKIEGIPTTATSTHSASAKSMLSFVNYLLSRRNGMKEKASVTHILDDNLSGVLLFAKSENSKKKIQNNWSTIGKMFTVVTEKKPSPLQGTIKSFLDDSTNITSVIHLNASNSHLYPTLKKAIMYYRTLETTTSTASTSNSNINQQQRLSSSPSVTQPQSQAPPMYTLLELSMETNYRDQIRAQLASNIAPICGDMKYGTATTTDPLRRLALHCSELRLNHPTTGVDVTIRSPIPVSFTNLIRRSSSSSSSSSSNVGQGNSPDTLPFGGFTQTITDGNDDDDEFKAITSNSRTEVKVVTLQDFLSPSTDVTSTNRNTNTAKRSGSGSVRKGNPSSSKSNSKSNSNDFHAMPNSSGDKSKRGGSSRGRR